MLHALATTVLAAAEEGEKSKTPFYICGGLLAGWALVLSVIGMRSADFPTNAGAQRGVQLISLVFVIAAMATAVITA